MPDLRRHQERLAITCCGVSKGFGQGTARTWALRGANLGVRTGEVMMLVGPSGCGKTTLLSLIAAILQPDTGSCQVLGQDLAALEPRSRALFRQQSIGFVSEDFNLASLLSVVNNVALPLLIGGMYRSHAAVRALEALDLLDLAEHATARPHELSRSQQQRVAIARAIVHHPRILVCDEPTSALDHAVSQYVIRLLRNLMVVWRGSLVVATRDAQILHFADEVAHMGDGRIVACDRSGMDLLTPISLP